MKRHPYTIVCFCAHNDDQIVGAGGTLAKYAKEGKHVYVIIFSFGEASHPHFKRDVAVQMRVKESLKATKILGGKANFYLGLKEGKFIEEYEEKRVENRIKRFLADKKPAKIFTHSVDDPHPDHRAVYNIITKLLDKIHYKGSVYSFDVWNPVNLLKRDNPRLIVDISATFNNKIKAMQQHESQKLARFSLWWNLYFKAFYNGLNNGVKYAEVFYKIR
jgi:LmbE family N-acetylglucosaminyl deacetylase